jgi:hypothetical protein
MEETMDDNSDGNDPLRLTGIINSLRRELREERFKRHELQNSNEQYAHKIQRLEHSAAQKKYHSEDKDDTGSIDSIDSNGSNDDGDEFLVRRLQSRSRHLFNALKRCQAERDDLKMQSDGQERIKEWMDSQLKILEDQNEKLQSMLRETTKQRDDALIQMNADSEMKDWLSKEWEKARRSVVQLEEMNTMLEETNSDLIVQIKADATMKEFLAGQLEVLEEAQKNAPTRRPRQRGRY